VVNSKNPSQRNSGFCCHRCLSEPSISVDTRQIPREPLLMAFVISLPAILWRLVTMFLMMGCWHPERKWSALSWQEQMGQLSLLDCLKRTACFRLQIVLDRYLISLCFLIISMMRARYIPESITDFAVGTLIQ